MKAIYHKLVKTLKQATYDTIHHHPTLSVEAIAEQMGMSASYLYRSATLDPDTDGPDASGVRFPLKQLIPLTRVTGDYQVLDLIEFTLGRIAIPLPQPGKGSTTDMQTKALNAVVEFGDLIREINFSITDGNISEEDRRRIEREGREAVQSIMVLLQSIEIK